VCRLPRSVPRGCLGIPAERDRRIRRNVTASHRRPTVGGRQSDEPAAMSLRKRSCQSRERPRKWPGSVVGRLYVGRVTTGVVRQQARPRERAGLRGAARTHDAARSAQAAYWVRHARGQGRQEAFGSKRKNMTTRLCCNQCWCAASTWPACLNPMEAAFRSNCIASSVGTPSLNFRTANRYKVSG